MHASSLDREDCTKGRVAIKDMAKQRIVNTKFWDDSYIAKLSPNEKLAFLYLLTSPLTNIAGVYELPLKRASFDIGISAKEVSDIFGKFEEDRKIVLDEGWIGIVNFIKHQSINPKVRQGIIEELKKAPAKLLEKLPANHSLCIGYDSLSHLNLNSNPNLNSNSNPNLNGGREATGYPQPVEKDVRELARKMRIRPSP